MNVKHHVYLINMMPELSDRPRLVREREQMWHATFGHPTARNHLLSIIEEQISWLRRRKHMYRYYILFAFILETGYFSNTCTRLYNKSQCWSQGDQTFLQYFHQVTTQSMMERLFYVVCLSRLWTAVVQLLKTRSDVVILSGCTLIPFLLLSVCMCVCVCACACMRACVPVYVCVCVCAHVCVHACVPVYVCVFMCYREGNQLEPLSEIVNRPLLCEHDKLLYPVHLSDDFISTQ